MPVKRFNFTKENILALPNAEKGEVITCHDTGRNSVPGLILLVSAGSKTFYLYRKIQGRPERIKIGKFPHILVEQARSEARIKNGEIETGKNPNEHKRKVRAETTLAELYVKYEKLHSKPYKRTWKNDANLYENHLQSWGDRKISDITKKDVQLLHAEIMAKHPHQANRVRSLLCTMFSKAIEWGYEGMNPCIGVKKYKEQTRDRFIQQNELKPFLKAVLNEPNETLRDYWFLCLYTGARQGNMMEMAWKDINFDRREWRIPRTKSGESHSVPLTRYALDILSRRKATNSNGSPWVFPGTLAGEHIAPPIRAWERLMTRADLTAPLRPHDLRRTLGSWMSICGVSLHIIGAALGHKGFTTTHIYARLQQAPVLQGMELAVQTMLIHAELFEKPTAEVIEFKTA